MKAKTEKQVVSAIIEKLSQMLPENWRASEGFFLDMFNPAAYSPQHISVRYEWSKVEKQGERIKFGRKVKFTTPEQRAEIKGQADALAAKLRAIVKPFRVRVDGSTIYILTNH